VKPYDASKYVP
jgi:hypothetical protein